MPGDSVRCGDRGLDARAPHDGLFTTTGSGPTLSAGAKPLSSCGRSRRTRSSSPTSSTPRAPSFSNARVPARQRSRVSEVAGVRGCPMSDRIADDRRRSRTIRPPSRGGQPDGSPMNADDPPWRRSAPCHLWFHAVGRVASLTARSHRDLALCRRARCFGGINEAFVSPQARRVLWRGPWRPA